MSEKIKYGLVAPLPGKPVQDLVKFTVDCEDAGFDSVWFPDHVLFMADKITPEVWSVITSATAKTTRIHLGAIGDPHRSHPAMFAHRLATIDNLSDGRIFSCLGYGEKMNLDYYGIEWNKPLSRLRESLEIMRKLWSGEVVSYSGEFYNLDNAEVRIYPTNNNQVPVYIAATKKNALKTAGRFGNGWVTNAMPTWVYSKKYETVAESMKENNVNSGRFEKAIYIFISVAKNRDDAYQTLDNIKHAIIWPDVIEEAGYKLDIDEEYRDLSYTSIMPNNAVMLKRFREMGQRYYTREILSDFVIYGTADDVRKRLDEYIKAGVNHFILRDFSPDPGYSFKVISEKIIKRS